MLPPITEDNLQQAEDRMVYILQQESFGVSVVKLMPKIFYFLKLQKLKQFLNVLPD